MTYESIIADLKAGKYAPVYLLHGEESYFIDRISSYIEQHALTDAEKAFNQLVVYGKEIEPSQIIDTARQYPMMSQRRVVVVKEAQAMSKIDELDAYVKNPSPQTVLVLNYKHKKIDGRSKLAKTFKSQGVAFLSKKLYDNQIPAWISKAVSAKGKKIDANAAAMMAEYLGADLNKITNEIDKIIVNLKDKSTITLAIVQEEVGITKDYNVFELQKAISLNDTQKAFRILQYFKSNPKSNPVVMVVSSLFGYFTKVYTTAYYLKKKEDRELAALVGVSPFFLREYKQAAKNFSLGKLVSIFSAIETADHQSKGMGSRSMPEEEILRELMIKIFY